jgi:carboxyl-terminal processing protease
MVFDFATKYSNENESIPAPEEFVVTDAVYNQFKDFVKENNFEYDSESIEIFEELKKSAKEEKYYQLAEKEIAALQAKLEPNLDKDLTEFNEEIRELLEDEIVSRYYYQKGSIRAAINDDRGIRKAIEALDSQTAYAAYFQPGTVINMN